MLLEHGRVTETTKIVAGIFSACGGKKGEWVVAR
jgi:hypothetical protein